MSEAYKELERLASKLGITLLFDYQPHTYPADTHYDSMELRWKCRIFRHSKLILATDYIQGVGFCEACPKGSRVTVAQAAAIRKECEQGPNRMEPKRPLDCLWSVCNDIVGTESHPDFESWATEFGYDPDSRKAHRIWTEIIEQGHAMNCVLGNEAVREIADIPL